ncbi:uncharacterized protein LOC128132809 [Lactuca sativa]|uniref:uncharacterized protein LOC128132809 n=1 Tax=Lactuca sativa TaxID=4236 RepID=UPI0022B00CEE|nr:uncharacterized protein LOC128132809 [Lactuca sativa]
MALLVPKYVVDEEMKKSRYHEMLRSDIRKFVSRSSCKMLENMIAQAKKREIDLDTERKRKPDEVQTFAGSGKRPKVSDSRLRGHHDRSRYGNCGRTHEGARRSGSGGDFGCFKCGSIGHYSRDCTTTTTQGSDMICFHCIQLDR